MNIYPREGCWRDDVASEHCKSRTSLTCSQGPRTHLHTVFVNADADVNEPCAVKFVVQRSNQCIAVSFITHRWRSLLFKIPLESEGQKSACVVFSECNLPSLFAGLVSGCQLAGWWDSTCCSTDGLLSLKKEKKGGENCHCAFCRLRYFNKESVYFNSFGAFFFTVLIMFVQPFVSVFSSQSFAVPCLTLSCYFFLLYFLPVLPFVIPLLSSTLSSPLSLSFPNPSVPLLSPCLWESVAHPKSASCRGLWEPMESPWPGMQAGSHGSAGMWGVWGDKSCEPSQGEGRDAAREERAGWGWGGGQGRVRRVRRKQGEQRVYEWGDSNTTP